VVGSLGELTEPKHSCQWLRESCLMLGFALAPHLLADLSKGECSETVALVRILMGEGGPDPFEDLKALIALRIKSGQCLEILQQTIAATAIPSSSSTIRSRLRETALLTFGHAVATSWMSMVRSGGSCVAMSPPVLGICVKYRMPQMR